MCVCVSTIEREREREREMGRDSKEEVDGERGAGHDTMSELSVWAAVWIGWLDQERALNTNVRA